MAPGAMLGIQGPMEGGVNIHGESVSTRPVTVTAINYSDSHLDERTFTRPEDLRDLTLHPAVTWISVDGVSDTEIIQAIGDAVGIHPLTLEDIMNVHQRPKLENYEDYLYVVVQLFSPGGGDEFRREQVSLILGRDYVISFQERSGDTFDEIKEYLRSKIRRFRSEGADYLFYGLLDDVVDEYFSVIEAFGERIESVEDEVMEDPNRETLESIYALRKSLIELRRSVWSLRDVLAGLERGESDLISDSTVIYLRDVYDHTILVAETVETYREMMSGVLDIYISNQSSKTNEIMKVLTIFATIFIPLTFLAGIYSMNFIYMPGVEHPLGYPLAIVSMVAVALVMIAFFRKMEWI